MEKNKTGKYLKYAFGEIVLVVIGILIALSINNWNEKRKDYNSEKEFIEGVKNDLEEDINYIDLIIKQNEEKIKAFNLLNEKSTELFDTDKKKLDSLIKFYFVSLRTFYSTTGSYQSAISGNEINNFKNKKTIASITKLYNSTYNRLISNRELLDTRWEYLTKKYSHQRRTDNWLEMNSNQFSELLDDMSYIFIMLEYYNNILNASLIDVNAIIQEN